MATEIFEVQAKFDWRTNAPEILATLTRGFRDLIEQTDRLKRAFETFDTGALRKLTSSLKQLREFSMPETALASLRETVAGMDKITGAAEKASVAAREVADAVKSIPRMDPLRRPGGASGGSGGSGGGRPTLGDAFNQATNAYFTGQIVSQAAGALVAPAYDLGKSRTQLLANNTPGQADAAIGTSQDLQRSVRGTNVQGNIEVYRQLLALTQNPAEARQLMGSFLPAGVALATFNPDGGGYDQQLESVMKSAEFKGALSKINPQTGRAEIDAAGATHMADLLLGMSVVSKGAVAPDTFLKFLRSGGTAAANMDMSEIPYLIPVIQALGAQRAGTGLKGLEQQFSSGKMSNAAVGMLQDMDILSKDPSKYRKLGMGQFMLKPGALNEKTFEEAVFHPKEFMDTTLIPKVEAYNRTNYGKAYSGATADQRRAMDTATLQQLASRIPGGTFMGEILRNELLSTRDNAAYGKLDPATIKKTMAESPQVAVESFLGSLKNLMGLLGGAPFKDAISVLNGFTATLNALSKAAQNHPKVADDLSTGATDLTLGGVAGEGLKLGGKAAKKYGFEKFGGALLLGGKGITDIAIAFAVDRILTGAVQALTGTDWAKWIDKHIPGAGWLDKSINHATGGLIGHDYSKDPVQKQSYITGQSGMTMQPINISFMLDGRVVAQSVTMHQVKMSRPGVQTGTNSADFLAMPMPAGLRTA